MTPEDRKFILDHCQTTGELVIDLLKEIGDFKIRVHAFSDAEWEKLTVDELEDLSRPIDKAFNLLEATGR